MTSGSNGPQMTSRSNGPHMTSGSTREFMVLCAIYQHFGRPDTPTHQAWIESLFGHLNADSP
jgi:putative transposase